MAGTKVVKIRTLDPPYPMQHGDLKYKTTTERTGILKPGYTVYEIRNVPYEIDEYTLIDGFRKARRTFSDPKRFIFDYLDIIPYEGAWEKIQRLLGIWHRHGSFDAPNLDYALLQKALRK